MNIFEWFRSIFAPPPPPAKDDFLADDLQSLKPVMQNILNSLLHDYKATREYIEEYDLSASERQRLAGELSGIQRAMTHMYDVDFLKEIIDEFIDKHLHAKHPDVGQWIVDELQSMINKDVETGHSFEQLGLNLLHIVDLILATEEKFKIDVPDKIFFKTSTVDEFINLIKHLVSTAEESSKEKDLP